MAGESTTSCPLLVRLLFVEGAYKYIRVVQIKFDEILFLFLKMGVFAAPTTGTDLLRTLSQCASYLLLNFINYY
jgi:hypothetical protein